MGGRRMKKDLYRPMFYHSRGAMATAVDRQCIFQVELLTWQGEKNML